MGDATTRSKIMLLAPEEWVSSHTMSLASPNLVNLMAFETCSDLGITPLWGSICLLNDSTCIGLNPFTSCHGQSESRPTHPVFCNKTALHSQLRIMMVLRRECHWFGDEGIMISIHCLSPVITEIRNHTISLAGRLPTGDPSPSIGALRRGPLLAVFRIISYFYCLCTLHRISHYQAPRTLAHPLPCS